MVAKEEKYPISWWFQQIWNICSSNCSISPRIGVNIPKTIFETTNQILWLPEEKKRNPTGRLLIFGTRSTTSHDDRLAVVSPRVEDTQSGVLWPNATGRVGRFQHVMSCWEVTLQWNLSMKKHMIHGCKNFPGSEKGPICFEWYSSNTIVLVRVQFINNFREDYTFLMGRFDFPAIDTGLQKW